MNVERNNRLNRKVGAGAVTIGLTIVAAFGLVAWHKAFGAGWAQVAYAFAPVGVALGAFLFNREKSASIDVAKDDASDV